MRVSGLGSFFFFFFGRGGGSSENSWKCFERERLSLGLGLGFAGIGVGALVLGPLQEKALALLFWIYSGV